MCSACTIVPADARHNFQQMSCVHTLQSSNNNACPAIHPFISPRTASSQPNPPLHPAAPQPLKALNYLGHRSPHRPHDPETDGPRPLGDYEVGTRSRQNTPYFRNKADSGLPPGFYQDIEPQRDLAAEKHVASVRPCSTTCRAAAFPRFSAFPACRADLVVFFLRRTVLYL